MCLGNTKFECRERIYERLVQIWLAWNGLELGHPAKYAFGEEHW